MRVTSACANWRPIQPPSSIPQAAADAAQHQQGGIDSAQQHHQAAEAFERNQWSFILVPQPRVSGSPGKDCKSESAAEESGAEDGVLRVGFAEDHLLRAVQRSLERGERLAWMQPAHGRNPKSSRLIDHRTLWLRDALE